MAYVTGRAVAVLYAREGADIAINYLPEEQRDAEETKRAVEREGRRCLLLPGDLTSATFCKELVERTARSARATRGAGAGVCVPRVECGQQLHHGHRVAGDGRRNDRGLS